MTLKLDMPIFVVVLISLQVQMFFSIMKVGPKSCQSRLRSLSVPSFYINHSFQGFKKKRIPSLWLAFAPTMTVALAVMLTFRSCFLQFESVLVWSCCQTTLSSIWMWKECQIIGKLKSSSCGQGVHCSIPLFLSAIVSFMI